MNYINKNNVLRSDAEALLVDTPALEAVAFSNEGLRYELQVHQVQLEMQNEALRCMQVALEESRDRYKDLYDFAPVGYLILTREGFITELNLTAAKLFGMDRGKLLNHRFVSLVTVKDGDKWYLFCSGVIKHNKPQNTELSLKDVNNSEFIVQLNCMPIDATLRITLTDITKIKETEAALRLAEKHALISAEHLKTAKLQEDALNRLQKITSQLPGMVFQFCLHANGKFSIPYASAAIHDLYRLSAEEVCEDASKLWLVIHPDDYDGVITAIQNSARNLSVFNCEYRVKFDDGTVRWLMSKSMPQRNADGSTLWDGFNSDITERKRIEDALKESEFYWKFAIEGSGDGVWDWNIQTDAAIYSRRWKEMLGYAENDIFPTSHEWTARIHPEDQLFVTTAVQAYLSGEIETYVVEYRFKCKNNDYKWMLSRGMVVSRDKDKNPLRMIGTHTDISVHKQAEQALILAQAAAEALAQSKADFLANMSHEIRTPMNAIIGLSQLALNQDASAEIHDYLGKIYSSSKSLLNILNNILDVSKLEAKCMNIEFACFDLDELLDNISNLFSHAAQSKGLDFTIALADDVPRYLVGDTLRLQQVLINLLGNAIKFTEQGAVALNITAQQIEAEKIRLLFSVTDTGIGILDADRDKLFQPFSQVDSSINRRFGGTGLGLMISHNLLQLMGSEFLVVSSPEVGSCFSFELILGISSNLVPLEIVNTELVDNSAVLTGTRILVVEDDLINQQVVCEFIKYSGGSVEIANNGREALELLEHSKFDAVLMDIHMPELNGFETIKLIRSQACFATLPVIAVTAGITEEQKKCTEAGMNAVISKPINQKQLLATLAQWITPRDAGIQQLPVLELNQLLMGLNNNQTLVTSLLLDFMESMKDFPEEIEQLITIGDLTSAREQLHKIKGISGNIGAMRLHAETKILEAELNKGLSTVTLRSFLATFKQTLSVIAALDKTEQSIAPTQHNNVTLAHYVAELDLLLAGHDFIPDDLLDSFKAQLTVSQYQLFYRLRRQLKAFNYVDAREILAQFAACKYAKKPLVNASERPMILIVDDVPTNVYLLTQALNSLYRIKVASNGIDALKIAQREQPDLILLDVMMPDMDGFEVCRQLKASNITAEIAVIFVTAKQAESDEELGFSLGALDYITKPFVIPIVKARIHTHIRLKQTLSALHLKDSALNVVANSILITDVSGCIEWANPAYSRLTGYSLDELQGLNPRELVKSGQQDKAYYQLMWDTILANKSWCGELVNRRKDGSLYHEEMTITPLSNDQGKITQFVAVKQEITQRMAITAHKLIDSLEKVRRRISSELHDRTSPNLAAINLNLNIITQELPPAYLLNISERIEDTCALIADTESSIREICTDMRPPLLDYAGLAEAIRSYAEQFMQRTGIKVEFDCLDHNERYAPDLESLLFRIFQEALTNCLKYADATQITVMLSNGGHPITLTITDNGNGFDPMRLGQNGHIGLGLLNMREMAEMSNGRFFITSALGQGTRIKVKIL